MASLFRRLLPARVLSASLVQEDTDVLDAGAYKTLQVQMRVLKAGSAGNLKLQHSAVLEPGSFLDLNGASVVLSATNNAHVTISNFLRYVRWVTDAAVDGDPIGLIDVVAKE